ncbi:MAG: hypothetical protein EA425_09025 [Puniceicoccaceae bacterium]|nr:MAG: hypothetical protein EA425_09025 [Puniceicoccaceae bacterium]
MESFELSAFIKDTVFAAIILLAALIVGAVLHRAVNRLQQTKDVPSVVVTPLRMFLRYGLIAVTFLLILGAYRVDIGNFWTFLSAVLGLIAIGFVAVWSMLSNLSATLLIIIFKPFRVGEQIELLGDNIRGRVADLSLMFTVIEDENGNLTNVPNNLFFQKSSRRILNPATPAPGATATPDHSKANLEGVQTKGFDRQK